jgi:hypothetical protein
VVKRQLGPLLLLLGSAGCSDHVSEVVRPVPPVPGAPQIAGCPVFPASSPWNQEIGGAAVDALSASYLASIGGAAPLFANLGTDARSGIPYVVVPAEQPQVPIHFTIAAESDPGPYPIPDDIPVESGDSGHAIILQRDTCLLYEVYQLQRSADGWQGYAGALWRLREDMRRPRYLTSADGAGLPVFPGLLRYDEIAAGEIRHALRVSVPRTQRAFVDPATHWASDDTDPSLPPMGLRLRLKASVDAATFPGAAQVIVTALQRYGLLVAENGNAWWLSGVSDARFSTAELAALQTITGDSFEAVSTGPLTTD